MTDHIVPYKSIHSNTIDFGIMENLYLKVMEYEGEIKVVRDTGG